MLLHQNTPNSVIIPVSIRSMHDAEEWFDLEMEISNGEIDTYGTIMDESSLRNFADDAQSGVSLLDSHNHRSTGYGRTFEGRYDGGKVFAKARIPLGGEFDGMTHRTSESVINFVKQGQIREVSIGFYDETLQCMNCDKTLRYYYCSDCDGYVGEDIDVMGDDGEMKKKRLIALVVDARLGEIPFVHSASNPKSEVISVGDASRAAFISHLNNQLTNGTLNTERYTNIRSSFSLPPKRSESAEEVDEPETDIDEDAIDNQPKRSSWKMSKELNDAKERITELENELDEVKSDYAELDTENKENKKRIKELQSVEKALQAECESIRSLCVEVYTERGKLQKKEKTEDQLERYTAKISGMGLDELRTEHAEQVEQRDIYVTIANAGDDNAEDGDADAETQTDTDKSEDKQENRQPFIYPNSLRGLGL